MPNYYQDEFFYDAVTIRCVNQKCHRYADRCLWDNEETTEYDDDGNISADYPPISTYDIALLQVTLSQEVSYGHHDKPFVASFSVDWKSDKDKSLHHVVRFDMKNLRRDTPGLTGQEYIEWCEEGKKTRNIIDLCFDRIASAYTAHHLGWVDVQPKTALYSIPTGYITEVNKSNCRNVTAHYFLLLYPP
jgi:hypothetical protein